MGAPENLPDKATAESRTHEEAPNASHGEHEQEKQ